MNNKKTFYNIQYYILGILVLVFLADRIAMSRNEYRYASDTALLNGKYSIKRIELYNSIEGHLTLEKYGTFWGGEYTAGSGTTLYFVCDGVLIQNLLDTACRIRKIHEVSKYESSWEKLSLDTENAFSMKFITGDGTAASQIYFGNMNYNGSRIYFRAGTKSTAYETEKDIAAYLSSDCSFWADPHLIPIDLTGKLDSSNIQQVKIKDIFTENGGFIKKTEYLKLESEYFKYTADQLPKLRHGKILKVSVPLSERNSSVMVADGKGNEYVLLFSPFEHEDGTLEYFCRFQVQAASSVRPESEKEFIDKINCTYSVSSWTYKKIFSVPEFKDQ